MLGTACLIRIIHLRPAHMSVDQIKMSVLKQPSLLQYSIPLTLQPKLSFFVQELGIPEESIGKLISKAPALMGFSLADNLRPKVASIMKRCALNQFEVGSIVATSPPVLLLNQQSKIEPALSFLADSLKVDEPRELGELLLAAPRVLHHSIASIDEKIIMLTECLSSRKAAIRTLRDNPALLVSSNDVLRDRIERCVGAEKSVLECLRPSSKGRKRLIQQTLATGGGDPILVSSDLSFLSLSRIYPDAMAAAEATGVSKSDVLQASLSGDCVDGDYFSFLSANGKSTTNRRLMNVDPKKATISIIVTGGIYPKETENVARGQTRTGGVALQMMVDGTDDNERAQLYRDFDNAAALCFGIRVALEEEDDGSNQIAIFPLINPSRNRCELFACSGALRVMETLLKAKRKESGDSKAYDINIFTSSNYAHKLLKSKGRLLQLGKCFGPSDMMAEFDDMPRPYVNIDIFHPLARSFSRLNGQEEPPLSKHRAFNNTNVTFFHIMDGILWDRKDGADFAKSLRRQALLAAKWQYEKERSNVW